MIIARQVLITNFFSFEVPYVLGLGTTMLLPGDFMKIISAMFSVPEPASPQTSSDSQIALIKQPRRTSLLTEVTGVSTAFAMTVLFIVEDTPPEVVT